MHRQQDALCPACGAVFRTRAHSIDCVEAPLDERYVDLALAISKEHFNQHVQKLKKMNSQEE